MSNAVKAISISAVLLIAIVGVAIWLLVSNLDSIVKRVVEEVGSDTLGTKVSLSSATVSLGDANAALRGLQISNPTGFKEKHAFELGAIEVTIDPEATTTEEIVLPKVIVDQAKLNFEQKGSSNNLQTLIDNIDSESGEGSGDEASEVRLVIKEFRLQGASMTLLDERLGEAVDFQLPEIVVRNIGREGAGVTAEEAAERIMEPLIDQTMDAAKARVKQEIEGLAKKELDKQKGKALDSVKKKLFGR